MAAGEIKPMTDDTRARELLAWLDAEVEGAIMPPENRQYLANAAASIRKLEAQLVALASPQDVGVERAALEQIAAQKIGTELERKDRECADWEGGFEGCVTAARTALASAPAQPEQEVRRAWTGENSDLSSYMPAAQPVDEDEPSDGTILALAEDARRALVAQPAAFLIDYGGGAQPTLTTDEPSEEVSGALARTGGFHEQLYTAATVEKMILHVARAILASRPTQGRKVREALEDLRIVRAMFDRYEGKSPTMAHDLAVTVHAIGLVRKHAATLEAALSTPLDPPEDASGIDDQFQNWWQSDDRKEAFDAINMCQRAFHTAHENGFEAGRVKGVEDAWAVADEYARLNLSCQSIADKIRSLIQSSQGGAGK